MRPVTAREPVQPPFAAQSPTVSTAPGYGALGRGAAAVVDGRVVAAVDVEDRHRGSGRAVARVLPRHAGQRDDGGHAPGPVAGQAVRHERAVGVADDVDAGRVDRVFGLDLVDDRVQVGDVVDAGVEEVAAGVGGVPEPVPEPVQGAVGVGEQEPGLVGFGRRPK